jgi:uncharacterized membrane protein YoaK (UPF0700 family)
MNKNSEEGGTLRISIGLAFVGGYADASSYLLAQTFTGHLTGNCVLAAVSAATKDWHLTLDRLLAVIVFLGGIFVSMILDRLAPVRLRPSSLAIAILIELLLVLSAFIFLNSGATHQLFIVCMCLALGIQNGALHKTKGISVHSTYMTGMVTTLLQKSLDHFAPRVRPKEDSSRDPARLAIQVLAAMWMSFACGAFAGAVIVSTFQSIGLFGIALLLLLLTLVEMKKKTPD